MSKIFQTIRATSFGLAFLLLIMSVQGCGSSETVPAKTGPAETAPAKTAPPVPADSQIAPPTDSPVTPVTPGALRPGETIENPPAGVSAPVAKEPVKAVHENTSPQSYSSLLFVFMLATFIGLGVILRVSRLLHTPLMSLTNAISAIAVVGSIIVTGSEGYSPFVRFLGGVALFASMTNIVSGFLITDRMLKMFKSPGQGGKR
jgi:H+-translocating NAD(P) transhydrogenase subunit alpha